MHLNSASYIIFTITAHNEGPNTATGLQVTDLLPSSGLFSSGLTFVLANTLSGTYNSTTGIWDIGSLLNGADAVLNITCNVTGTGTIINWANVTAQTTPDSLPWSKDNITLTVPKTSDVDVITEFRDLPWGNVITDAHYNDKVYVIVKVNNNGPDLTSLNVLNSLTGITWTGTYYVISSIGSIPNIQSNWVVNDTTNTFNGTNWNIPSLSSSLGGTAKWLAIEGIINQTGTLSNHAETVAQSTYPYHGYNSDTAYLTADTAPTSLKAENAIGVKGQTVNLTATLNDANRNPLAGKTVTFTVNGKNYNKTTDASGIATLNYTISETAGVYTLTASFTDGTIYTNSAGNGSLTVKPLSDLYINTKSSNSNPAVGETFMLTYKLGNNGPNAAENVTITFQLPEGLDFVNIKVDEGNCTYNEITRTVTWTLDSVPVGDPYLYLTVKAAGDGTYKITPSITTTIYSINSGIITINIQSNNSESNNGNLNGSNTVNAASKTTIELQDTGLPLNYLILAVLMIVSGLIPRRK